MLDSSPVALTPIPRPLKRSASTASLPTPPQTHRKRARGKSRESCDSDSGEDVALTRTAEFHITRESPPVTPKTRSSTRRAFSDSPDNPFSATPKTRSSTRRALRDSPDNPFLVTPENHAEDTPSSSDSAKPSPHAPLQERPTIAYVFRGVRRECKNPLYDHAQDRPFSPPPESKLAVDHPDYSPAIHCIPKRLFVDACPKRKKPAVSKQNTLSQKRARQRSPSFSADEGDVSEIRPLKLDFGSKKRAGVQTLDQELRDAGESLS